MSILVTGSLAYDVIMTHDGKFTDHLIKDELNHLNVSFLIENKVREYGGCGGNIAYNLSLLGEEPRLFGRVGQDFDDYEEWLTENNINTEDIIVHDDTDTAVAYITTDTKGNQIMSFYPGAMEHKDRFKLNKSYEYKYAIISPENTEWMMGAVDTCEQADIPILFDPGQQITALEKREILFAMKRAQIVVVNGYEHDLLCQKTGLNLEEIIEMVPTYIITKSEKGSVIYYNNQVLEIGIAKPKKAVDPTGCGDAYRAGIVAGVTLGFDWQLCGELGATLASFAVEEYGTQNHYFELEAFNQRLKKNFGKQLNFED